MRFQVLRHALAPAFVWVLVAFACGSTIAQLALQRVQVIEAEHPVVIDANGVVVGAFDSTGGPGGVVAIRLEGCPSFFLVPTYDQLQGNGGTLYFSDDDCEGIPLIRWDYNLMIPVTPVSVVIGAADAPRVYTHDPAEPREVHQDRSFWTRDGCENGVGSHEGFVAFEVPMPSYRPPFTVVMRSDLRPAP